MQTPAPETPLSDLRPRQVPDWLRWLEVLVVTGTFIGFGLWTRPDDPFYLQGNFPWPALAPLLVGLRYGFFMALVSGLIILALTGWQLRNLGVEQIPWTWGAGVLATGLLAGEFRDYWERKLEQSEAINQYSNQRLEEFTRNFYLLKVSHDRLEQQLAGSSGSLREALRRLYGELALTRSDTLDSERAELMLQLLVRYGQLQTAAIYRVDSGEITAAPLAVVGDFQSLRSDDPLLRHALEQGTLVSIQTEYRKQLANLDTDLLIAIPFVDSAGGISAVCAIKAIPFFSFQTKTLRLLAILAGHMADMLTQQQTAISHESPDWQHLRFQSLRAASDAEQFQLPSTLLSLETSVSEAQWLEERMTRLRRGLDVLACDRGQERARIVLLMPLTDELGLAGYLQRLEDDVREQTGKNLQELATIDTLSIGDRATVEQWLAKVSEPGATVD